MAKGFETDSLFFVCFFTNVIVSVFTGTLCIDFTLLFGVITQLNMKLIMMNLIHKSLFYSMR